MLFSRTALPQRRVWLAVELPLLFGRDCAPQRNAVEGTAESQNGQASERFLIRRQDRVHGLEGISGEPPSRGDIFQGEENGSVLVAFTRSSAASLYIVSFYQ